jgi:amino acid efflux transporter
MPGPSRSWTPKRALSMRCSATATANSRKFRSSCTCDATCKICPSRTFRTGTLFAFVGWEAVSHLSGEFDERGLRRATVVTLSVVGLLWMGLSVVTIGVLGGEAAGTVVPLTALLETGIGEAARPAIGVAAVLLTFGALNTYIAGTARLGAALARDRVLPRWLNEEPDRTPLRNLALLAAQTALVAVPVLAWAIDLDVLLRATAACLAAVTAAGAAAAVRLLPPGRLRRTAMVAMAFTAVALVCCGPYLLGPLLLSCVALRKPYPARERASHTAQTCPANS